MAAAASSIANNYLRSTVLPCKKAGFCPSIQVRAQSYRDEGRSSNIVDANLRVLRERIEEVKMKERVEKCFVVDEAGWNYAPAAYSFKRKRDEEIVELLQLLGIIGGTFGFTILSCTFCLCIISFLLQLNH